jgi:apolipoprotein D and lipocalin family protein
MCRGRLRPLDIRVPNRLFRRLQVHWSRLVAPRCEYQYSKAPAHSRTHNRPGQLPFSAIRIHITFLWPELYATILVVDVRSVTPLPETSEADILGAWPTKSARPCIERISALEKTMIEQVLTMLASPIMLLAFLLAITPMAPAQTTSAVPKLDAGKFIGTWYALARYPIKREKRCLSDDMVLYALGDKRDTFQVVTSCQIKDGNSDYWNDRGKLSKTGDGSLRLSRIWPFTARYWVLATGPAYEWALVGTPNHRSLWVLSKSTVVTPEALAAIEATAAAQGFNTAKLVRILQHN